MEICHHLRYAVFSDLNSQYEYFPSFIDCEKPIMTGPNLEASYCTKKGSDKAPLSVDQLTPKCQDNVDGVVQATGVPSNRNFPVGETKITVKCTDKAGNEVSKKLTIIVKGETLSDFRIVDTESLRNRII